MSLSTSRYKSQILPTASTKQTLTKPSPCLIDKDILCPCCKKTLSFHESPNYFFCKQCSYKRKDFFCHACNCYHPPRFLHEEKQKSQHIKNQHAKTKSELPFIFIYFFLLSFILNFYFKY